MEAARCQWPEPHRNLEFVSRLSCRVQRHGRDLSVGLVNVVYESNSDTATHIVRLERSQSDSRQRQWLYVFRFRPDKLWGPARLLCDGYQGPFFSGEKLPKRDTWVLVAAKCTQDNIYKNVHATKREETTATRYGASASCCKHKRNPWSTDSHHLPLCTRSLLMMGCM